MILGIDIGGTKSAVCIGSNEGEVRFRREFETDPAAPPEEVVHRLIAAARELLDESAAGPQAIGVSCGGPLDPTTGTILRPPNLPLWDAVPIRTMLEKAFPQVPVTVENDANATAIAEWTYGAGRGTRNMVYSTMGTGIGAGIILEGKLYRGTNGMAGEIGHQTIRIDGPQCGCGKRGCLEALASGPAIARLAQESLYYGRGKRLLEATGGKVHAITARHVVDAAKQGDSFSRGILAEAGEYMGIGLANVIQIVNPEKIILGTIAVHAGELILAPIRQALEIYAWERNRSVCEVTASALGDRAQDMAAIAVATAQAPLP